MSLREAFADAYHLCYNAFPSISIIRAADCFFLLLFVATSDFCIAQCMTKTASKWGRKAWVVLSLCVDLGLLGYFKYFNFLRRILHAIAHELG